MKKNQLFLSILLLVCCFSTVQARLYVKPTASGNDDGSDWGNATTLSAALSAASAGEEIFVAAGEYTTPGSSFTFNNVKIYGSFAGTETELYAIPDTAANKTILKNATVGQRVLKLTDGAEATGFYITGGDNSTDYKGGGVYMEHGTKLNYCHVYGNKNTTPTGIVDGYGGGIYMEYDAQVTNSWIYDNLASTNGRGFGGGIHNISGIVDKCIIEKNVVTNVTATSYASGGGLNLQSINSIYAKVYNCIIRGNKTVSASGGAIGNEGCKGGGINARSASAEIVNCLVVNNEAIYPAELQSSGAGIYIRYGGVKVTNCTVVGNKAYYRGGIFVEDPVSTGNVFNSIIWGNTAESGNPDFSYYNGGSGAIHYSIFTSTQTFVNDNFPGIDPLFIGASIDNYRLSENSPAINNGSNTYYTASYPAIDLAGKNRTIAATIDIGAYEFSDFIIPSGGEKSAVDYSLGGYSDIIFKSDDTDGTGRLTDISESGLTVDGIVKLEKIFTTKTWYPIGFPFEIDSIYGDFPTDPKLYIYDETEDYGDFWLQSYNGETDLFSYSSTLEENTGYGIQFPTAFENKKVTFFSENNPVLRNVEEGELSLSLGYHLIANPSVSNLTLGTENTYYLFGLDYENNFGKGTGTVKPFESFVTATDGALRSSLGTGNVTGLGRIASDTTNDPVVRTQYYTLQGKEIQQPVSEGVYIVKNTHASQQVKTTKIVYNPLK
jgi:hypothetical protein